MEAPLNVKAAINLSDDFQRNGRPCFKPMPTLVGSRSEEHTSELQSLMRISYAVFCLNKKTHTTTITTLSLTTTTTHPNPPTRPIPQPTNNHPTYPLHLTKTHQHT